MKPPPPAPISTPVPASNPALVPKNVKVTAPPRYHGNPNKRQNWIFLTRQYLHIVGITNDNDRAKYAVGLLEGKALTWWRGYS